MTDGQEVQSSEDVARLSEQIQIMHDHLNHVGRVQQETNTIVRFILALVLVSTILIWFIFWG